MSIPSFSNWHKRYVNDPQPLKYGERELAAVIGWDGVQIFDPEVSALELCLHYVKAMEEYSCGQCVPCRVGSRRLVRFFERLTHGRGTRADLRGVTDLARMISLTALCDIGKTTPKAIISLLENYGDDILRPKGGQSRAFSYRSIKTAPCMQACPIHLDIPRYIEAIRMGDAVASLETIKEHLPLPGVLGRVCVRPCESSCRRGLLDQPLQIKHLKRFAADNGRTVRNVTWRRKGKPKAVKVAVVGAGPAGLTCSKFLAERGYDVTIFELLPEPGGMAAVGIPDYRLPREALRNEILDIEKLGVKIVYEKALGVHFTIDELELEGFKAVFIGMGCHCHKSMGVEGEDKGYYGYTPGIYFLRNVNLGLLDEVPKGKKMVVIGGGNVAVDCVRTSFRVGFEESHLVYRRSRREMPADTVEVDDAEAEGVRYHFLTAPKRILGKEGRVVGLECLKIELGEPDASGRRRPVEVPGSEFVIDADAVVAAIGQEGDYSCMCNLPGVNVTPKGAIVVNEHFSTTRTGVFSGGDCITGPDVLVSACAHGRLGALHIDRYLREGVVGAFDEEHDDRLLSKLEVFDPKEQIPLTPGMGRVKCSHEAPEKRKFDFREIENGFSPEEATAEAKRCLRCYRVVMYVSKKPS